MVLWSLNNVLLIQAWLQIHVTVMFTKNLNIGVVIHCFWLLMPQLFVVCVHVYS